MKPNRYKTLLILGLGLLIPIQAHAQSNVRKVNVNLFEPNGNPKSVITVDSAATMGHLGWYAGAYFGYALDPLEGELSNGGDLKYVHNQLMTDIVAGIGFWHYFELGLHMPVVLYQDSDIDSAPISNQVGSLKKISTGDLRILPKVRFFKNRAHGFGVALIPQFTVPTGLKNSNAREESVTFEPKIALDYRFEQGTLIALNLGYRMRKKVVVDNLAVDDEIFYGLGVEVPVYKRQLSILGEAYGAVGLKDAPNDNDSGIDLEEAPLEALLGARYRLDFGLTLTLGGGMGLTEGYGTPVYRLFFGAVYASPCKKSAADSDGDGIVDKKDSCPNDPEDRDGFADRDGCPDPDNDKDGICDNNDTIQGKLANYKGTCKGKDLAPNDAEDLDGFEDSDGKPEPDNDKDGICDNNDTIQKKLSNYAGTCRLSDGAPDDPEDKDGFEDNDGVPDADNDKDGICDNNDTIQRKLASYKGTCKGKDVAPNDPEDLDGFEDSDGKPDPDNDGDGLCDNNDTIQKRLQAYKGICKGSDACPDKKENVNGIDDDDGCPDKAPTVVVTRRKVRILKKIFFETGKAKIKTESHEILDAVAKTLKKHGYIKRVRIEGHTDKRGGYRFNIRLSRRRAQAVKQYLVKAGISAKRLTFRGYGYKKRINKRCRKIKRGRKRRECRAKNRRVEFTILKQVLKEKITKK